MQNMHPRKILVITNRIPFPLKDGGNMAMNTMIQGYHDAGMEVYLLSMNTSRHFIDHARLKTLFTHLKGFEWVDINNELRKKDIIFNFLFSREPEHVVRFYKKDFEDKIVQIIGRFKPDIIQIESVYLTTYLPAINKNTEALTVLRMHNIEFQIWRGLAHHGSYFKKVYLNNLAARVSQFERSAWQAYDLLLPITEKDAAMVLRLEDVNALLVAPFSLDLSKIKPASNEKWVGYHIGAMDWIANQEGITWFLNKAWKSIRKAVPGFEFYFAGRNMPESFKNLQISGVHCLAEVESAEDFISDKKILIVPLWSGGGIRVKILEAMAAGKVVITTPKGIKGIEARPGQHYLLASTSDEFVRALSWCMENKEAAEKMAKNAMELIRTRYEYMAVTNNIISEIEKLLNSLQNSE